MLMLVPGIIVSAGLLVSRQPSAVFFTPFLTLLPIAQAITLLTTDIISIEFSLWISAGIWIALITGFHRMSHRLSPKARERASVGIGLFHAACIPWSIFSLFSGISG